MFDLATVKPKFPLGQIVATPGAIEFAKERKLDFSPYIDRHVRGDWGDVCNEDWMSNNASLIEGSRIISSYLCKDGEKFWIITEADRSSTCILLPKDY